MDYTMYFLRTVNFWMWHGRVDYSRMLKIIEREEVSRKRAMGLIFTASDSFSQLYVAFGKAVGYDYATYISLERQPWVWNGIHQKFVNHCSDLEFRNAKFSDQERRRREDPIDRWSLKGVMTMVQEAHDEHAFKDCMKAFSLCVSQQWFASSAAVVFTDVFRRVPLEHHPLASRFLLIDFSLIDFSQQ
jgi:hypothetical protein